jgi:mRNA-degrading endonuclease RelE of RelBE toxin-antitoxin system
MPRQRRFVITFAPEVLDHLDAIERRYYRLIEQTIDEQLSYTPGQETRNRKPLEQPAPFSARWELRFGPDNRFRVFYQLDASEQTVWVLAIGVKVGNRLLVGGKEFTP